jgi:hypothetical protein
MFVRPDKSIRRGDILWTIAGPTRISLNSHSGHGRQLHNWYNSSSEDTMSTLTDENVIQIAKDIARANEVSFAEVTTAPVIDSTGSEAIEIKIVLTPGSSEAIRGERSARTVSQLIQRLADAGEGRFPIVRWQEQVASP